MAERTGFGGLLALGVMVLGLTVATGYLAWDRERLLGEQGNLQSALSAAEEGRNQAEEKANIPEEAAVLALLAGKNGQTRAMTQVAPAIYRVWQRETLDSGEKVEHVYRVSVGSERVEEVLTAALAVADTEPVFEQRKEGDVRLLTLKGEKGMLTEYWSLPGEFLYATATDGLRVDLYAPKVADALTLTLGVPSDACSGIKKTVDVSALSVDGLATPLSFTPSLSLPCVAGVPSDPWKAFVKEGDVLRLILNAATPDRAIEIPLSLDASKIVTK